MSNANTVVRDYLIPLVAFSLGVNVTADDGTETTLDVSAEGSIEALQTILVASEQMYVKAVTSNGDKEITVVRGVNGSTGVAHAAVAAKQVNIYTPRFPKEFVPKGSFYLFFQNSATPELYIDELRRPTYQFNCYGATEDDARESYETIRPFIHGVNNVTGGTEKIKASKIITASEQLDEDADGEPVSYMLAFVEMIITQTL